MGIERGGEKQANEEERRGREESGFTIFICRGLFKRAVS